MAAEFIIVESNPVVAMDLCEVVIDWCPGGAVHVFSSLREAQSAFDAGSPPHIAIGSLSSEDMCLPKFAALLGKLAKNVVVISDVIQTPAPELPGCVVVRRPFTARMIVDALVSFGACRN